MLDILKLSIALTIVAIGSGLVVAFTYYNTGEEIQAQERRNQMEALEAVFPDGVEIKTRSGNNPLPSTYWVAQTDSGLAGYAFKQKSKGYAGDIQVIVGVAPSGEILGLNILSHKETPGLGDRVSEKPSKKYIWNVLAGTSEKTSPWFTEQFKDLSVFEEIKIDKSTEYHTCSDEKKGKLEKTNTITAITGATISTRAVKNCIRKNVPEYLNYLKSSGESS
ncbi:MAG: RnfABCDGE type electron transport complex subunit G [Chitinivibrionales bacterium]|nr:RnfABCDGE type electron transport complex subunit G [Chitinivibrionales bacterium]